MTPLSWTPRHVGRLYCSPACGRGCTYAEYRAAQRKGRRLAAKCGIGWKVRVWENMGWHALAQSADGNMEITEYPGSHYFTTFAQARFSANADTIQAAIDGVLIQARREFNALRKALKSFKNDD